MATKPKKAAAVPAQKFVTAEVFEGAMTTILDRLEALAKAPVAAGIAVPETKEQAEIKAAGPNRVDTNPEWDAKAKEILGDFLDHTEVMHERSGGIKFTVVIKTEKSNASAEYLAMNKTDRRTKDVGATGMDGVTEWCRLVRSNLKRTENN